jgi:hypothetical protein
MTSPTAQDIASTARRVGWTISDERAAQIAGTAAPTLAQFAPLRERLQFDDEAASFADALAACADADTAGSKQSPNSAAA